MYGENEKINNSSGRNTPSEGGTSDGEPLEDEGAHINGSRTSGIRQKWKAFRQSNLCLICLGIIGTYVDGYQMSNLAAVLPMLLSKIEGIPLKCSVLNNETCFENENHLKVQTCWALAIALLVKTLCTFLLGFVYFYFNSKCIYIFTLCIATVTIFVFSFVHSSYAVIVVLSTIISAVVGVALVAVFDIISDDVRDDSKRTTVLGVSLIGKSIGLVSGAPFASLLYDATGEFFLPIFTSAIATMLAILIGLVLPTKRRSDKLQSGGKAHTHYKNALSDRYNMAFLFMCFVGNVGLAIYLATSTIYLEADMGISVRNYGFVTLAGVAWQFLMSAATILLARQIGRWLLILVSLLAQGIAFIVYRYCHPVWEFLVPEFLIRMGFGIFTIIFPVTVGYFAEIRGHNAGVLFSLFQGVSVFGSLVAYILSGILPIATLTLYWIIAVILLLCAILSLTTKNVEDGNTPRNDMNTIDSDYQPLTD